MYDNIESMLLDQQAELYLSIKQKSIDELNLPINVGNSIVGFGKILDFYMFWITEKRGTVYFNARKEFTRTRTDNSVKIEFVVENQDAILGDAFNLLNIPEILHGILKELVMSFVPEGGGNLAEILSESLTLYAFIAISYVLLGIVIFIIFKILEGIAKKANEQPGIGVINRIFGGVVGAVIGLAICFLVCYGISTLSAFNIGFANDLIVNMKIPDDSVWTFAKALFNNNLIAYIISLFI